MVVNTIFRVLPLFNDGKLAELEGYVTSSYLLLGRECGKIVKEFLNANVNSYTITYKFTV